MTRLLCVGDIHLSDRPPSSCTDTYLDDLFDLLEQTVDLETKLECDATVWAGDVFHHKQPSRTSHRTVMRLIDLAKSYQRLMIVPGNHDMLNDRVDSVDESQPLGVLARALGPGSMLSDIGWVEDLPLFSIPWQQDWTLSRLGQIMVSWRQHPLVDRQRSLVVTHASIFPPGLEPAVFEFLPTRDSEEGEGWASLQEAGFVYYGHIHDTHGTFQVGGVTFCNQGAISRGSLHESDLTREVAVTVWDSDSGFTRVPLNYKPASEVFRLAEIQEVKDSSVALDEFLGMVGRTQLSVASVESVVVHIREMNLDPDVEKLAVTLLEDAM